MPFSNRLPLVSADPNAERVQALCQWFPDAVTEGKIDFDRLKQAIGEFAAIGPERYELTWAGKSEAKRILQQPSIGTLAPCRAESINFDATENMITRRRQSGSAETAAARLCGPHQDDLH